MKNRIYLECDYCGEEYSRRPSNATDSRFCSRRCQTDHRREFPNDHFRDEPSQFQKLRSQVIRRDAGTCVDCGWTPADDARELQVHHIIPVLLFETPHQAQYEQNLITLCSMCHPKWEPEVDEASPAEISEKKDIEFIRRHFPDVYSLLQNHHPHLFEELQESVCLEN